MSTQLEDVAEAASKLIGQTIKTVEAGTVGSFITSITVTTESGIRVTFSPEYDDEPQFVCVEQAS
jgi:hypothetical protein